LRKIDMINSWNDEVDKELKGLILTEENWADITNSLNKSQGLSLSVSAVKSYAYRRGLSLSKDETDTPLKTRANLIAAQYNYTDDDSIPVYKIESKETWIPIWLLGDMHIGSSAFDEDSFMVDKDWALQKGAYLIGVGDWLETSIPGHMPKTMFGQNITPDRQREYAAEIMLPFKGKTITIVDGNHEKRISDATSFMPLSYVATELDALHMPAGGMIVINVNGIEYNVVVKHGHSFANNNKEVEAWGAVFNNADVVVSGHTHTCLAWSMNQGWQVVDGKKVYTKQIGIRSGHYLSNKGYVEEKPYKPLESESMVLWLNTKTKQILVSKIRSETSLV
jgi:predicted phosphodiesterase